MAINQQGDTPIKGILFLVGGIFVFSTQDVLIKYLSNGYPLFEILFIRSLSAIIPCLLIVHFDSGLKSLKTKRVGAHLLRATFLFLAYVFYYLGVAALPLANAVALFFTAPFFVTVLSVFFLYERVKLIQWMSLFAGFFGVLIIMSPQKGIFNVSAVFPILAALTYALSIMITRRVASSESGSVMGFNLVIYSLFISAGFGLFMGNGLETTQTPACLVFATRPWILPPAKDLVVMMGIGLFLSIGSYCLAQAYRLAKSSIVTPFEYTAMVPAVLWGFVFWGEVPSASTLLGILFIISSGLYLIRLETRHKLA